MTPAAGRAPGQGGAAARQFRFSAGSGRHRVWGTAFLSQGGLVVSLVGGDVSHIGAVALSIPRPSLRDAGRRSATTSVLAIPGHKEDEIARPLATELARRLGRTTVIVAGVHIRHARPEDIERVVGNTGRALEAIIAKVRGAGRSTGPRARREGSGGGSEG